MMRNIQQFDTSFEATFDKMMLHVANQLLSASFPDMDAFAAFFVENKSVVRNKQLWTTVDGQLHRKEYQPGKPFSLHHFTMKTLPNHLLAPNQEQKFIVARVVREVV
jgi:hypothetical protein